MSKVEEKIKKNKLAIERNEQAIESGMSSVGRTDLETCIEMRLEFIDDLEEIQAEQEENRLSITDILDVIDGSIKYNNLQNSFKGACNKSAEEVLDEVIKYGPPSALQAEQEELQEIVKYGLLPEQNKPVEVPQYVIGTIEEETEVSANISREGAENIARDLYEETITWGWNEEDFESVKKEEKFRVNKYYAFKDLGRREIFKVLNISDERMFVKSYRVHIDLFTEFSSYTTGNSIAVTDSQLATEEDVERFERAEHFHSKHREYNEIREGDKVRNNKTGKTGYVRSVDEDGDAAVYYGEDGVLTPDNFKCTGALYLDLIMTAEELEAASKEM